MSEPRIDYVADHILARAAFEDGFVPVVVQDVGSLQVLMLAYTNLEALKHTLSTGLATFWSRSRQKLWTKGETSGNKLLVRRVLLDCDDDAIVFQVEPMGPACHRGTTSCFSEQTAPGVGFLAALGALIAKRNHERPLNSYTTELFESGAKRIAQKVGEEGVETALAATSGDRQELENESADLLYHLLVLLEACGTDLPAVTEILRTRHTL